MRYMLIALMLTACASPAEARPPVYAPIVTTLAPTLAPTPSPTPFAVDRLWLQNEIAAQTNANWSRTGVRGSVTRVLCIPDADALHLVCNLVVAGSSIVSSLTVKATCDTGGGCVWRPE